MIENLIKVKSNAENKKSNNIITKFAEFVVYAVDDILSLSRNKLFDELDDYEKLKLETEDLMTKIDSLNLDEIENYLWNEISNKIKKKIKVIERIKNIIKKLNIDEVDYENEYLPVAEINNHTYNIVTWKEFLQQIKEIQEEILKLLGDSIEEKKVLIPIKIKPKNVINLKNIDYGNIEIKKANPEIAIIKEELKKWNIDTLKNLVKNIGNKKIEKNEREESFKIFEELIDELSNSQELISIKEELQKSEQTTNIVKFINYITNRHFTTATKIRYIETFNLK